MFKKPACVMKVKKKMKPAKHARLDPFARGMIVGMHVCKLARSEMQEHVTKKDGSPVPLPTIDQTIAKFTANPDWRGQDVPKSGRPDALTEKQRKQLVALVFRERGRAKVTVGYCKKKLLFLRRVSDSTVGRELQYAGLQWLTRRTKKWVPQAHREMRVVFARARLCMRQSTLDRYAFTDGAAFYLARSPAEAAEKGRFALGKMVWRYADGRDGLFNDTVGPSLYAKAQGRPVKVWGFMANGRVEYHVLPVDPENPKKKSTNMNTKRYHDLINRRFATWRRACFGDDAPCHLVQDHEKCLWHEINLAALKRSGCPVVSDFPKSSPDLNSIEGFWNILRQRLHETQPQDFEDRPAFLVRLRRSVTWLNENKSDALLEMCNNQKQRARDVLAAIPPGAKTKW